MYSSRVSSQRTPHELPARPGRLPKHPPPPQHPPPPNSPPWSPAGHPRDTHVPLPLSGSGDKDLDTAGATPRVGGDSELSRLGVAVGSRLLAGERRRGTTASSPVQFSTNGTTILSLAYTSCTHTDKVTKHTHRHRQPIGKVTTHGAIPNPHHTNCERRKSPVA